MPGLEGLRGSRGGALPGYLGPCCHPCCPSPYHHHQGDVEVSLQYPGTWTYPTLRRSLVGLTLPSCGELKCTSSHRWH